jgi:hypothetical protein
MDISGMIKEYGCQIEIVTFENVEDPLKPWLNNIGGSSQFCRGVFLNYKQVYEINSLVQQGDKKLLVAASDLTTEPTMNGEVRINNETWKIQSIEILAPDNIPILYTMRVRRS